MTIETVIKNINTLEESLLALPLESLSATPPAPIPDLGEYMACDEEVAKAVIRSKNPKLRKRDVDRMIGPCGGEEFGLTASGATSSVENLKDNYLPNPDKENSLREARDLKKEIRKAFKSFLIEVKKIGADLKDTTIVIVNAIPSIAVMISAPPWNIPAAIIQVLLIVKLLREILMSVLKLLVYLNPLSKIGLVLPPGSISKVLTPLNASIVFLIALLNPLNTILSFITKLVNDLKRREGDCDKQRRRITRQLNKKRRIRNRKQRKINRNNSPAKKDIGGNWKDYYFKSDLETEINFEWAERLVRNNVDVDENNPQNEDFIELLDEWDDLNEDLKTLEIQLKNVCAPVDPDIESSLKQIESSINNAGDLLQEITTNLRTYTVKFPDGTIRRGVTEVELEDLKDIYDVEFRNSLDIDLSASLPNSSIQSGPATDGIS
jgi:hypothetical protein